MSNRVHKKRLSLISILAPSWIILFLVLGDWLLCRDRSRFWQGKGQRSGQFQIIQILITKMIKIISIAIAMIISVAIIKIISIAMIKIINIEMIKIIKIAMIKIITFAIIMHWLISRCPWKTRSYKQIQCWRLSEMPRLSGTTIRPGIIFLEISCFIPDLVFIRFGKFIRIHFNQFGKVSGADMEVEIIQMFTPWMKKMFTQNFEMKKMFAHSKFLFPELPRRSTCWRSHG